MTQVRRWLDDPQAVPVELQRALADEHGAPGTDQLRSLADQLGRSLGVALAPPPPVVETVAAAKLGAAVGVSAAKPLLVLGAWILGGVVLGAGLSGLARLALPTEGPAPRAQPGPLPPAPPHRMHAEGPSPLVEPPMLRAPVSAPGPGPTSSPAAPRNADSAAVVEPVLPWESELQLLKRAQSALSRDPGLALALTRTHFARFEHAKLDQEREMIAIDALRRLGRRDEALRRGEAFRAQYPRSAHLHRLDGLLEDSLP